MQRQVINGNHLTWFKSALFYFIIAAIFGTLLRYGQIGGLPDWIDFRNIRHAHSHLALLGWLNAAIYILIVVLYKLDRPIYSKVFWATQSCVLGMMFSFPLQGYKSFSIVFLSLFILLTYVFIYLVYNDTRKYERDLSIKFLYAALFFLFLSSIGTWSLAPMIAFSLKGTAVYYGAIQFYLHFQFNGWLIFGVLALFIKFLSIHEIQLESHKLIVFFWLLIISTFLTFALAITWSTPINYIFWLNSLGVIIQLIALFYFLLLIKNLYHILKLKVGVGVLRLLYLAALSFILKIAIQTFVAFPLVAVISYTIRNFVVGFIHLLMLGCISLALIAIVENYRRKLISSSRGLVIFVIGIISTEIFLFLQGLLLWRGAGFFEYYYECLFFFSLLLPIGLIIYFFEIGKALRN